MLFRSELLERMLGVNGRTIWLKSNGIDKTPVYPYNEGKSISTERTFEKDTTDASMLKRQLVSMVENLTFQLRQQQKLTSCITIKIRYSDFNTHTSQARMSYTSLDHTLIEKAKELFEKLFEKRLLARLIGVKLSHLVGGNYQYNLFEEGENRLQLY